MARNPVLDGVRHPEYTGENRCIPCTVVNVVIAAVVSGFLGLVSIPVAVVSFALFASVIYLRGYLIPGTPTLTKRYLPDRVLRLFDKEPMPEFAVPLDGNVDEEFDVEEALLGVGALEESDNPGHLSLQPDFREMWYSEMDRLDDASAVEALAGMLGVPESSLSTEDRGMSYAVKVEGETAGKWESSKALLADMAAERVLGERADNWTDLSVERRSGLLRSLRVYLDRCPRCGGTVQMTEETVASCCRSREVFACKCQECSIRLFEINASEVDTTAG